MQRKGAIGKCIRVFSEGILLNNLILLFNINPQEGISGVFEHCVGRDYKTLARPLYILTPYITPSEKVMWLALLRVSYSVSTMIT